MSRMSRQMQTLAIFLVVLAVTLAYRGCPRSTDVPVTKPGASRDCLLCFWNLENFFDDKEDARPHKPDKEYDLWYARNPAILHEKLDHLSKALIDMNDGKGPDILAIAEVESERAADLLRDALNARLTDPALHYGPPLMKEVNAGRHIATAILTRLPAQRNRTQLLAKQLRILEGHLEVNGHELAIIASHWSSRLHDEGGAGRDKYADQIFGRFRAMYRSNPKVDFLVCGDFNDSPDDVSVTRNLHANGDREAVKQATEPMLLDLFIGKDPNQFGTLHYHQWCIFDHIVVSPGLLDDTGWTCDVESVRTVNTLVKPSDRKRHPWRFGGEHDKAERGYSDHFPVTVRLKVQGTE